MTCNLKLRECELGIRESKSSNLRSREWQNIESPAHKSQIDKPLNRSPLHSTHTHLCSSLQSVAWMAGETQLSSHSPLHGYHSYRYRVLLYIIWVPSLFTQLLLPLGQEGTPHHPPGNRAFTRTKRPKHHQYAWLGTMVLPARCGWRAQAQWTDVRLRQPLMIRECLPGQVWRAGKESQTAWTAGGVRAVHWLMFRFARPSSSLELLLLTLSHLLRLLLTRLFAREYMARSVMFWQ